VNSLNLFSPMASFKALSIAVIAPVNPFAAISHRVSAETFYIASAIYSPPFFQGFKQSNSVCRLFEGTQKPDR
jgi:hypothetical protein